MAALSTAALRHRRGGLRHLPVLLFISPSAISLCIRHDLKRRVGILLCYSSVVMSRISLFIVLI